MNKKEIQELFYKEKNYSGLIELLKDSNDFRSFNILGKVYLYKKDLKNAYKYFEKENNITGCAYCKLLSGNRDEALALLLLIKDSSPFVNWIISLIEILKGHNTSIPTYFQIRNFYEQDLEQMFRFNQLKMAEEVINKNPIFEKYNREIYKYAGRVLFNNNYIDYSEKLLIKSLDICYKDPESHFIMGEIYLKRGEIMLAIKEFEKSNEIAGEYLPAYNKLKVLKNLS